jgi:hypothetical protein
MVLMVWTPVSCSKAKFHDYGSPSIADLTDDRARLSLPEEYDIVPSNQFESPNCGSGSAYTRELEIGHGTLHIKDYP